MNKERYLKQLVANLKHMDNTDKQDIYNEYETHFISGKNEGKSEEDIAKQLGDPKMIAKELNATMAIEKVDEKSNLKSIFKAILAVMGLGLFNFFIVLVPAFFILMIFFTLIIFTLILFSAPIFLIIKFATEGSNSIILYDVYMAGLMFGVSLMLLAITILLIKWFLKLTVMYLKWNVSFVKGSVHP
ncbi:DUF1700 domain-containing protein [Staphylococcus pasteuri]|uniref:HAAS signaling domain-containing protein n=1 Tax=Staphylococcus TaxID=1279 RepID=UPI00086EF32C|nr:DUF1700 domain-containing protein [Staphylococcus pasteuri]MCO0861331.1 DUF1700 domain-containing protein [Staphylococcus pasteuri]MCO5360438.1 DUF1700 domain-containing protein [Staphylococcus pasteuri]ODB57320.1 hypothetical protein A9N02_07805 [Staphylococcus sp. AOAB]UXR67907.1 DUF1700 domain-containing protein [Staphylococcus pasteuri]